jgi:TIR domain
VHWCLRVPTCSRIVVEGRQGAARTRVTASIFISYSHKDTALVEPVVALLRASRSFVYLDKDSIRPGKKWREELDAAIAGVDMVVVFWCEHSEISIEVGKEITAAVERGKDILPLRLDGTALPARLAEYQYIDFRAAFEKAHAPPPPDIITHSYSHGPMHQPSAASAPKSGFAGLLSKVAWAGFVFVLVLGAFWWIPSTWLWPLIGAVLLILAIGGFLLLRRPAKRYTWDEPMILGRLPTQAPPSPKLDADVQAIVGRIEQELHRKLGPLAG